MLISHSRCFVYIHVNRTGGSSFASVLGPYVDSQPRDHTSKLLSRLRLQRDPRKIHFRAHDSALTVQRRWPKAMFDAYYKFAFVRNPWSWLVSVYHRILGTPGHRHNALVAGMSGYGEFIDFEIARAKRFQHTFVLDDRDQLLVDFVGRFESLQDDFDKVCNRLSIEHSELPTLGGRKQVDYRELYDDVTRAKVQRHWKKDIELFEYDFE